ncbi:MAG TPA: acyl carrier protein [Gemmatimonadales bacterium]|jgi:acyl carrier protein|nr:acyl carrier protein [Gemmatimonadales bacterium]
MTRDAEAKLQDIIRAALELPRDADVTSARQPEIGNWDSLAHVSLMLGIESEFGVSIAVADQLNLTSYSAIRGYLEDQGVGRVVR